MRVKTEARRQAILNVAAGLFLADGYANTSMAKIAATIGGSKATLYNYFSNKEDIFSAIVSRRGLEFGYRLFEIADTHTDIRQILISLGQSYLDLMTSPEIVAINRLVISEAGRIPELGRIFFENGPQIGVSRLALLFKRFMESGQIKSADPLTTALHFKSLCDATTWQPRLWNITENPWSDGLETSVTLAVDAFLGGYGVYKPH